LKIVDLNGISGAPVSRQFCPSTWFQFWFTFLSDTKAQHVFQYVVEPTGHSKE